MATSSNRDVKMTLSVETLGQENIKTLQNAVASLAKEGGDAAPEFQQLADEIGRIGEQAQAIAAFKDLAVQTDALAAKQQEAATKASELAAKLALSGDAAQTASQKQKEASAALLNAKTIFDGTVTGIKNLNAGYKAGEVTAENYKTKLVDLTAAQGEQRNKFAALSAEVKLATTELRKADAEQTKLTGQYTRADAALTKATQALSTHNKAVAESAQAAEKLGTSTENVATSEAALLQALNASRTAALARTESMREMADSDKLVAIQAQGMAELLERGRVALIAEETAIREAARASADYASVRNAENAARKAAEDNWQKEADAIVEATEAKLRNIAATKNLIEAQNFLIAQDADAKWWEEAAAMTKANEASFNLRREKERLTEVERQLATEIKQTGDAAQKVSSDIANAFRTVGVRSAQELEAEIVQVRQAMDALKTNAGLTGSTLKTAFATGEAKIKDLERELRSVNGTLTMGDKTAKLFANSLGQISAGNVIADGVGYLVNKVKELGQAFLGAIVQGDQLKRGLNAVYKDAAITAQQIDFLRKASSESGVAFGSLSGEFVKFTASMKMANIPMAQSNALFQAVTAASASLGLSAEATGGALNALGQMASKGTVSLEELRAQLGDRLPGALGLTAQGLGITEGQLIKLVESGQLATRDFVVPFTQALGQLKGETDGLMPTWERFKGLLSQTAQAMGDTGGTQLLTGALKILGGTVATLGILLSAFTEGIFAAGKAVLLFYGILSGNGKEAWAYFNDEMAKSNKRLSDQKLALDAMLDPAQAAADATTAHAAAMTANTAEVTKSIAANTSLDNAQKLTALSTALAGDATLDAGAKIVQYNVAAAELLKSQANQTDAFEKLAKAAKEQGDTLVENAKLTGDNTAIQTAALQAAQLYAEAIDKATASQSAETAMLVAQKAELEASAAARGLTSLQIKTQVDDLNNLILASKAETEQSIQVQAAARAEVASRQLVSAALLDNSSRVEAYAKAVKDTQAEIDRLMVIEASGIDVTKQLAEARKQNATALYMERDATKDLAVNIDLETKAKSAVLQLSIAQTTASQNHYTALAAEARASGDVKLAVELESKAREEAIRVLKLKLELDKLQQASDLLVIENKRKLYLADTEENAIKNKQLDIESQILVAKGESNKAIVDQIAALEKQSKATDLSVFAQKEALKTTGDVQKALNEMNLASQGLTSTISVETQGKVKGAQASLESAKARYEDAKASGDELGAAEALVKVKEAELELATVMAQAKREEAAAARQVAAAKQAEAQAAAETARAIQAEIAASEVVTEAMKKQAAEANVNAIAKAGAAKEAYAHANALDIEANAATKSIESAKRGLDAAKGAMNDMRSATLGVSSAVQGLSKDIDEMGVDWSTLGYNARIVQAETLRNWKEQRAIALPYLASVIGALTEAGNSANDLSRATDIARAGIYGLNQEDLMPLRSAIADAQQRMKDLGDDAQNTINGIQDELDGLNGNYDDIEKRRYESRKLELESKREEAKADGNQNAEQGYIAALRKLEELYAIKIADATKRENDDAKRKTEEKEVEQKKAREADPAQNVKSGIGDNPGKESQTSAKTYTVNVNIAGKSTAINTSSDADAQALIALLQSAKLSSGL